MLDGYGKHKKAKATKYDKLPLSLLAEYDIDVPFDYMMLLPSDLPDAFTAKEFAAHAKIPVSLAQTALLLLSELGLANRVAKQRNAYLYEFAL